MQVFGSRLSKHQMSLNMQDKLLQVLSAQTSSNLESQRRHNRSNQHTSRRRQGTTWSQRHKRQWTNTRFGDRQTRERLCTKRHVIKSTFLSGVRRLSGRERSPSRRSTRISASMFERQSSTKISRSIFRLIRTLFHLIRKSESTRPRQPSNPQRSCPTSKEIAPSRAKSSANFASVNRSKSVPQATTISCRHSKIQTNCKGNIPLQSVQRGPLPRYQAANYLCQGSPSIPLRQERE